MNHAIRVEVERSFDGKIIKIAGYVDGREIMTCHNMIYGKWSVGSSTCLPSDIGEAEAYVDCMQRVFQKMEQIKIEQQGK